MIVARVPLSTLHDDPDNARTHGPRNLEAIKSSLELFGQVEPLVVQRSTKMIIGGNGRHQAMLDLGWDEAGIVYVDLDPVQAHALGLALNRTAELATWDFEGLASLMKTLQSEEFDISKIGWSDFEIEPLLEAEWHPEPVDGDNEDSDGEGGGKARAINVTPEQREVIERAIEEMRGRAGDGPEMSEGRALELVAADWLS